MPRQNTVDGSSSSHATTPPPQPSKSASISLDRFKFGRKAISGSASVEVSYFQTVKFEL